MKPEKFIKKKDQYVIVTKKKKKILVSDLQKEVLSVMDEIERICQKNNIHCFLIAGSSLGMCNYGGFIPWDDDMDIAIPYQEWDQFVSCMKKDLKENFYFDSYEIDKRYNVINGPWMKVRKKNTYIEEVNFLLKNRCKRGNGIFVDVIPYGPIAENKWIDELERTVVKINMPFIVLLDNLHINPILLKNFVYWFSKKCFSWHQNSKLVSQPVSVPWEKFLKEPVFQKEDVYPLEKYEFENRMFYSYHNIEKIMKEWYGPNCLKKWNGTEWEETLPKEKRHPKHVKDLNLTEEKN